MVFPTVELSLPALESEATVLQAAVAGAAAGSITRAVAQPLDVLKIRFQLQIEPITHGSKYSSVVQAFSNIVKEEGITTLWSGHIPAQVLSITYGLLQFSVFEKLTQLCQHTDPKFSTTHKHAINFSNGTISGAIATIASYPFDTVRTRLIAEQKTSKVYNGFIHAFSAMVKTEGTRSLFKGLIPTLAQIAPHAGVQFLVYKLLTRDIFNNITFLQRKSSPGQVKTTSLSGNLIAGSISGVVAKTIIYPFDVVKKRLQVQGFQQYRSSFGEQIYCKGVIQCVLITVNKEGYLALFKGYGPSMLKAMLVTALHFSAYDEIKYLFLKKIT